MSTPNTSWVVPLDLGLPSNWGNAICFGIPLRVWVQSRDPNGFWVQVDPNGPFRLVSSVDFD